MSTQMASEFGFPRLLSLRRFHLHRQALSLGGQMAASVSGLVVVLSSQLGVQWEKGSYPPDALILACLGCESHRTRLGYALIQSQ